MNCSMSAGKNCALAFCLAVLSTGTAFAQTPSPDAVSSATTAAAHVAYVYVGTTKGVDLYAASSNGTLTLVSGSPFTIAGSAVGSNGKYFISLGTAYLHSYPVASNGAIKGQVSQINTQSYSGSECGSAYRGTLDHSGQYVYTQLAGTVASGNALACDALQSFKISSAGALSFLGATEYENDGYFNPSEPTTPIAITGSGNYAYSFQYGYDAEVQTYTFQRESSGAMMSNEPHHETDPSGTFFYTPAALGATGDPTNHLAIADNPYTEDDELNLPQLASYTVASNGDIASTNTSDNVPTPQVDPQILNMSPSGQYLAVGGSSGTQRYQNGTQSNGLQVFHFNGANPITSYSGVLTTAPINEIHWDNNNHLYALSNSTKKLYVYSVTSSSITAAPGSPYTIAATPNALTVVPITTACTAPASAGVHICAPASGSTVSSPVQVQAAATVTGTISNMQLWIDGVKKYTAVGSTLNTSVSVATGTHRFAVIALNTAGQKWESAVNATVK